MAVTTRLTWNKYNNLKNITIPDSIYIENSKNSLVFANTVNLQHCNLGSELINLYYSNMRSCFLSCTNYNGTIYCTNSTFDLRETYRGCKSLVGNPVCGPNVTNMYYTYRNCKNLIGNPICGNNVVNMYGTYLSCDKLTGDPVCGPLVENFGDTYAQCYNLTGNPVCGPNVQIMWHTYFQCRNLTGSPVCGPNVTDMNCTYFNCSNILYGNMYIYSNGISDMNGCFQGKNQSNILNIFINKNTKSLNTALNMYMIDTTNTSLTTEKYEWINDSTNNRYYNTSYNIYIYPVDNVSAIQPFKYNAITMKNED